MYFIPNLFSILANIKLKLLDLIKCQKDMPQEHVRMNAAGGSLFLNVMNVGSAYSIEAKVSRHKSCFSEFCTASRSVHSDHLFQAIYRRKCIRSSDQRSIFNLIDTRTTKY